MSFLPLERIRVVDMTSSVAGPYCTALLGALGADVVKIEHPARGDESRTWGPPFWNGEGVMFLSANASKRSLALDVKDERGRELLWGRARPPRDGVPGGRAVPRLLGARRRPPRVRLERPALPGALRCARASGLGGRSALRHERAARGASPRARRARRRADRRGTHRDL